MRKKILRREFKKRKENYSLEEKKRLSKEVWKQLEEREYFQKASTILLYWSMDDELFTHDFVNKWRKDKEILLPKVVGDDLELRRFEGEESLCKGSYKGLLEPVGELFEEYKRVELVIVPGVAFDHLGARLGRGKGYYDKTLIKIPNAMKVGVCFSFQMVDEIPRDEWDVLMDEVITTL